MSPVDDLVDVSITAHADFFCIQDTVIGARTGDWIG